MSCRLSQCVEHDEREEEAEQFGLREYAHDSATVAAAPARSHSPKGRPMSSRKLGELATDIDDASETVGELKHTPPADAREKLDELHKTLEDASDTIDELVDKDETVP
jgi:hypothetical protein